MVLQHTALVLTDYLPFALEVPMQIAGGLTFGIMGYLLVEGYRYTRDVKKYIGRLFLFGVISQVPYSWAFGNPSFFTQFNIMFTLALGLLLVHWHETMKSRGLFWTLYAFALILSLFMDWGLIGIIMIVMYKTIKDEKKRRFWPPMTGVLTNAGSALLGLMGLALVNAVADQPGMGDLVTLYSAFALEVLILALFFALGGLLGIVALKKYDGTRGKSMKYLFYVVYPLHFVVLALIHFLIENAVS